MYAIHEEPEFVVVVKSSGLLSVPGRGPENLDCVSERVKARYPGCIKQPSVHRLDGHFGVVGGLSNQRDVSERNARFFGAEADKLDGWADDLKVGLERELKELDCQIKETRRAATAALTLEEKLAGQKQVKALESQRNLKRRSLFDAQDEVP